MTDVMKYLRDAPLTDVVLRVAGRPDIDAAALQAALRGVTAPVKRARSGPAPGTAAALLAVVSRVARILPGRSVVPILDFIRLTIRDGIATLTTTDMERTMVESVAWDSPDCDGLVPGKLLLATLKAMAPDARPIITQDPSTESKRMVKGAEITEQEPGIWRLGGATLRSAWLADFPNTAPPATWPATFDLSCDDIRRMFGSVAHCQSTEETRYYLNGVFLHVVDGELRTVATDGHRLGRSVTPAPDGAERMPERGGVGRGVIVPTSAVKVMLDSLPASGTCQVEVSKEHIRVTCGAWSIVSKLVDGTFPDYQRVTPAKGPVTTYSNAELAAAVKAVRVVSSERSAPIRLAWPDGDGCEVSATDVENGTALREVTCGGARPAAPVGMQARYLLDILAQLGETVWVSFGDTGSPMLIGDDSSLTYVLLPMRL